MKKSTINSNLNTVSLRIKSLFVLCLIQITTSLGYATEPKNHIQSKNGTVAYTWNANPSAESSTLSKSRYTFNNDRPVTRTRPSVGVYKVKFKGLTCNRGQFIVNAYGGTEYKSCRIGTWQGKKDCEVSVYCFDSNGQPLDSQFNLLFVD